MTIYIFFLILLALTFDFLNGFHDSANSIATVVSTRVLSPRHAVLWAAFFNFVAFLFLGLHVANTIGKGIVDVGIIDPDIIFATLVGACVWDIITWYYGLPTSSSHALIGGMVGAALVKTGPDALIWTGIIKTITFIFVSPTVGLCLGLLIGIAVYWTFRKSTPRNVDHIFRKGQLFSAALYSLGHGGNDAQKTMGIIAGLLFSAGLLGDKFYIPFWVVISCQSGHCAGDHVRRLAHREDHGSEDRQAQTCRRVLCRDRCCHYPLPLNSFGYPGKHNPYHHRVHHGCGVITTHERSTLGCSGPHRVGLDTYYPGRCSHIRHHLLPCTVNIP